MRLAYRYTLLFSFTLIITQVNAQGLEEALGVIDFIDQVDDTGQAPIHMLVWLGMLVGSYLGFRKLK